MDFLTEYRKTHAHPVNRALHSVGIPMIILSVLAVFFNWKVGVALFVLGWIFQFLGHFVEGKPPAFFKDPRYLIIGPYWWARKVLGLERSKD